MIMPITSPAIAIPPLPARVPWERPVQREPLTTLQLNLGRFCNLACTHCHIEAGPKRTEMMSDAVRAKAIAWIRQHRPRIVDLTGGAPELIPGFRELVIAARAVGAEVIDRCNLTVLQEPGQEDLAMFLASQRVHVVASMPCYLAENVDKQRGKGTYDRSIQGLRQLNAVGYGVDRTLPLQLVYNPGGAGLPPPQEALEQDYRLRLQQDWGISFTGLWCLANVPITRFRRFLEQTGALERYEQRLRDAYNPDTLPGLMCRTTLSVDYAGRVYDCDFNLALDLPLADGPVRFLWDIEPGMLPGLPIAMRPHCLACTAGCGSSCTGAVVAPLHPPR
jgi:radical SAM/Cys-rich protein